MARHLILTVALFVLTPDPAGAQTVFAVVLGNQNYVVGSSTLHSGLYYSIDTGRNWHHLGPRNLKAYSMDAVSVEGTLDLYIAAGNGVHRSVDSGRSWEIVTDWRVSEVLDVLIDPENPARIVAATAFGLWESIDRGATWSQPSELLADRYLYRLAFAEERIIAVGEERIYHETDSGWTDLGGPDIAGPAALLHGGYDYGDLGPLSWILDGAGITFLYGGEHTLRRLEAPAEVVWHTAWLDADLSGIAGLIGTFGDGVWRIGTDNELRPAGLPSSQVWRLIAKPIQLQP